MWFSYPVVSGWSFIIIAVVSEALLQITAADFSVIVITEPDAPLR